MVSNDTGSKQSLREQQWFWFCTRPRTAQMISVPQMIPKLPRPEMIPANGVAKYREWRGLHEKFMDVY